jgi:hypothetical protein
MALLRFVLLLPAAQAALLSEKATDILVWQLWMVGAPKAVGRVLTSFCHDPPCKRCSEIQTATQLELDNCNRKIIGRVKGQKGLFMICDLSIVNCSRNTQPCKSQLAKQIASYDYLDGSEVYYLVHCKC